MKYDISRPYTAAHIILRKNGKVAFLLRQNTNWGDGYYGLISGKVDHGESFLTTAVREAKEEAGIVINRPDLKYVLTAHRKSDELWVDVVFETDKWQGEAHNAEPDKHGELVWLDPADLPDNVVEPIRLYLDRIAAGQHYAEFGWD
jgi:8-oxo-dGTP diphosphatase